MRSFVPRLAGPILTFVAASCAQGSDGDGFGGGFGATGTGGAPTSSASSGSGSKAISASSSSLTSSTAESASASASESASASDSSSAAETTATAATTATTVAASTTATASATTAAASTATTASTTASTTATTASTTASTAESSSTGSSPVGELFFSEYVEGTSNNKAVEIVNTGAAPISLSGCTLDRYQNGAGAPASPALELDDVMLDPGHVFVVCHTSFSEPALCDQLSDFVQHSGDDVIALHCADGLHDVIGRIGEQLVWGMAPTRTRDATLRRKCTVLVGDLDGSDAFDPSLEWDGFPVDTFDDLGQRTCP